MREEANDEAAQAAFDMEDEQTALLMMPRMTVRPMRKALLTWTNGRHRELPHRHRNTDIRRGGRRCSPMRFSDGSPAAGLPVYAAAAADLWQGALESARKHVSMTESERRRDES